MEFTGTCQIFATLSSGEFILFAFTYTESCRCSINVLYLPQLKSGIKSVIIRKEQKREIFSKAFQPGPEIFNGIEFWRVGRKKEKSAFSILGSKKQPLIGMEETPEKSV